MSRPTACAGLSDPGRVRERNEDAWVADPVLGLYAVSDGMATRAEGALASRLVVETLPRLLVGRERDFADISDPDAAGRLAALIAELSNRVRDRCAGQAGLEGMGATLVAALVRDGHALVAHMGDSRAYLCRGGRPERLTVDHSIVQLLIDGGELSPEQAASHPARGQLSRYVGMPGTPLPEVRSVALQPGDVLLLCSDGLTSMLDDGEIGRLLGLGLDPDRTCARLIEAANEAGGRDNLTAVVVSV